MDGSGYETNGTVSGSDGYTTPADTDSSGTADHLESGVAGCLTDTDGDGIPDETDLDDDNDGILDTEEGCIVSNDTSGTNLITNGSLSGGSTLSSISDWSGYSSSLSPDVNNISNPTLGSTPSNSIVTNSADGGTWIGIHDRTDNNFGDYREGIHQTLELTAGTSYIISFEQANFGAQNNGLNFINDGKVEVFIDTGTTAATTLIGDGGAMALGTPWNDATLTYTAAVSGTHSIGFRAKTTSGSYLGAYVSIDGIQVKESQSTSCAGIDTDNDGTPDHLDTDSDGDGCFDVLEAGYTDANNDGEVDGSGYETNGTVSGSDGYTTPADTDSSGTADHLEAAISVACSTTCTNLAPPVITQNNSSTSSFSLTNNGPQKQFGGTNTDTADDMLWGNDGSLYIIGKATGSWAGYTVVDPHISGEDAYIAKLNPQTLDAEWVTYLGDHHTNMQELLHKMAIVILSYRGIRIPILHH